VSAEQLDTEEGGATDTPAALPALDHIRGYVAAAELSAPITDPRVWVWLGALVEEVELLRRITETMNLPALSEAQQRVYHYLRNATTMTLGEIGSALYVSENTVKSHAKVIYAKLGVTRRRDLQRYPARWR